MLKINILILILIILILILVFSINPTSSKGDNLDLKKSYDYFKTDYMSKDGRIMDPQKNNITTSEGQSYMLIRNLVSNDKKTFDLVYDWTKNNLRRKDGLYSWIWGKNKNGKYTVLDYNSASYADIDIAYSLIFAYKKWKEERYLQDAILTIHAIWDKETKRVDHRLVLMPGAEQTLSEKIEVNPSYFAPYSFRVFQKYDDKHDWNELIDSSYYYLQAVTSKTKTGLPPNWFLIENGKNGAQIVIENSPRGDFSYDAIRIFWRVYTDYKKTREQRAVPILEKSKFFIEKWKESKTLYVNYQANGMLRDKDKFIGSISILIPVINLYDKKVAAEIYDKELVPYFIDKGYWQSKNDYYGRNLLWFGEYMYRNKRLLK